MPSSPRKRLTAVWSRDVDPSRLAGRTRMISAIRELMSANYEVRNLRLQNLLEKRTAAAIASTAASAVRSIFSDGPPSLQSLLFCDRGNHRELYRQIESDPPDVLYCDGVRAFYFLKHLAPLRKKMRVVVDFDDLMSRRMAFLAANDAPLSMGYLHDKLPSTLRGLIASGGVSKAVARYEQAALSRVEDLIGHWADAVTLISPVEAGVLERRYRALGCRVEVRAIPPPVRVVAPPRTYSAFSRFLFIGTDTLPQNKLTIDRILNIWRMARPASEIHIFGHMVSRWPDVPGVVFRGYVPSLAEVYVEGAASFAPGVLRGGLKTKVAEAFAYGCAVIGNEITFEGLRLDGYPLVATSDDELIDIAKVPESFLPQMRASAVAGQDFVAASLSPEMFQRNWNAVLG